ncbi:hypothetical protein IPJ70_04070 [Candidatus Campbellbacteria bacterium]|nr:MAG: hypothetical protein IPJ70_04070 [Candidatus Campbellbacteria bacterium]
MSEATSRINELESGGHLSASEASEARLAVERLATSYPLASQEELLKMADVNFTGTISGRTTHHGADGLDYQNAGKNDFYWF